MPSWDFDAARLERLRSRDPITFTFGGRDWECLPIVPLASVFAFVDIDRTQLSDLENARSLAGFVADMLIPEQANHWWETLKSKDALIDPETLGEVVVWLSGLYSGRPTSPSIGSSAGPQTGGRNSSSKRSRRTSATSRR